MRHWQRWAWLTVGYSVLISTALYGQSARVIYEAGSGRSGCDHRVSLALERRGCRERQLHVPIRRDEYSSRSTRCYRHHGFVIRVRLQDFTGGDKFGRLALVAGNGFWRTGQLPSTTFRATAPTALGPGRQTGTVLFGTWVGSGHQFGMRAAANRPLFAQALPRSARRCGAAERDHAHPDLQAPALWDPTCRPICGVLANIDPTAFPTIALSWATGGITGARALISFDLFGTRASPHSDRLRLRSVFTIYRNG
jgi:hypothetical protein